MIISVEEAKRFIASTVSDEVLEAKLQALELMIQGYTNNNFKRCLTSEGEYPMDVKMGVVNMLNWDLENRNKVGIQSETISRHSVTYFNMDGDNSTMGFPKALLGFLKPYMKARF
jgi:hypothetical protein